MRCPNCGTENPEDAKFCQKCSTPLVPGAQAPMGPMMAPPPQKKSNTMLIVVIVIVVVVALIVAGTLLALNALNHTNDQNLTITFTGKTTVSSTDYSIAPPSGEHYEQITVNMHNRGDSAVTVTSIYFSLTASGTKYGATFFVDTDTETAVITAGSTMTFKVSFAIPDSSTPTLLTYQPILGSKITVPVV